MFLTNVIKFIENLVKILNVFNDWKKYLEPSNFAESPFNRNALGTLCINVES